ncbi:Cell cycle serine/threonine-protein kinase cdc5/MSD2 [Coemansia sp. RSA 2049]|nr:Cell cycle serine/threonine-protein kinase cdc5/MSD2 [Coemansia sp. RSA 2049]
MVATDAVLPVSTAMPGHISQSSRHGVSAADHGMFVCADGVSVPAIFADKKQRRYRVVSMLGRGAFGRCYEVKEAGDVVNDRSWACKTIDKESITSTKVAERIKYEVKVMRVLPKHPNVVASHYVFEDPSRVYILMELCTSRTLHDLLLKRKRLTEFEARYFTAQLASGLNALHSANIIHRDIKHSNLLLDHMNRIKIADFGLSTILASDSDRKLSFLGTPNFLAPELISRNGEGHSRGVDIWATGVILFFMLYGRPPFNQRRDGVNVNLQQLYNRIVNEPIPFPKDPPISTTVKSLVNKLCCKKESARIRADDICNDTWFVVHPDSDSLPFMPEAIFQRPIRTLQEYKELVNTDPGLREQLQTLRNKNDHGQTGRMPQQSAETTVKCGTSGSVSGSSSSSTAVTVASVAEKPYVSYSGRPPLTNGLRKAANGTKPSVRRQPLEPVPERENRLAAANISKASMPVSATAALATRADVPANCTRRHAREIAESEKENRPVTAQFRQMKLRAAHAAPPVPSSHGYALRPRATNGPANGAGCISGTESRIANHESNSRKINSTSSRMPIQMHEDGSKERSYRVEAEFGRVTKLSEEYVPSIMMWKNRLQKFCEQTTAYIKRSSSSLEEELELGTSGQTPEQDEYPRVGIYVLNWMMLPRYGLGFRLSDGTVGTLFNDNTSLLQPEGTTDYVYVRPFENRSSIGYYSESAFPAQLEKKRKLLSTFARHIRKMFSAKIDCDLCPDARGSEIVKCLLQALSTTVGMVFLLTGNVLQFNMEDHSKLFLYKDAHIFYKSSDGKKWHFDLRQGPIMLIRDQSIDIERFLLCLAYAQRVLESWNLHLHGRDSTL